MANIFNSVKMTKPQKNVFDLSHDVKLSFNMGLLIPTLCLDTIPGDSYQLGVQSLLRFAPLVAPVMHRYDVYHDYFFVPKRLLWDNYEKWITNTKVAGSLPAHPYVKYGGGWPNSKLYDYLGVPPSTAEHDINAMPLAAYQFIYNEYYRDQNLIDEIPYKLQDGNNTAEPRLRVLRRRAWEHDYFTSALPFAQKGDAVSIPLGDFNNVPVLFNNANATTLDGTPTDAIVDDELDTDIAANRLFASTSDLVSGAGNISDLRRAFKLQEWLEKAARGGSRLAENTLAFFGLKPQDSRLQRPELISRTKSPVIISEVLNTTGTETAPQGDMAGHGVSAVGGSSGSYFCHERGYIICMTSVMPKPAYQQGIPKHFLKINSPMDEFWPQFENIGEQPIENRELYAESANPTDTFGYTPRYAEYKFCENRVAGEFRTSLDFWHNGRQFGTEPALNQTFIECDPDPRVFAVIDPNVDHLYSQIVHQIKAVRPMAKYGNPSF